MSNIYESALNAVESMFPTQGLWQVDTSYADELRISAENDPYEIAIICNRGKDANTCVANAHLIAAAPELLKEISEIVEMLSQGVTCNINPTSYKAQKLRAVLDKARGIV